MEAAAGGGRPTNHVVGQRKSGGGGGCAQCDQKGGISMTGGHTVNGISVDEQ